MSSGLYSGVSGLALGTGLYRNVSGLWSGASGLIAGFDGGNPYGGASLYLDFLNSTSLDSRITFTRGSNATLVDSTGKITYAPANLLTYSEQFDNAAWIKSAGTSVTANATTAPDGTTTADRWIKGSGTTGAADLYRNMAVATLNVPHSFSFFAKANGIPAVRVVGGGSYSPTGFTRFNLDLGTVATGTGSIQAMGNGWYRCTIFITRTGSSDDVVYIAPCNADGTFPTGNGTSGIYLWGAQLEPVTYQTTPSTYQATTSSAYYGPRFDYDPVTLAAKGLLIEEQRTNLLTYSEQFDNAAWVKINSTVTANAATSPDGTVDADKWVEDATSNPHQIGQNATFTSGETYTYSFYAKKAERSLVVMYENILQGLEYVSFNLDTGVATRIGGATAGWTLNGFSMAAVGNGWYRCVVIATPGSTVTNNAFITRARLSNGSTTSYTGNGTSGVYLWGAQLEAGAFATSYIPTTASTVTRSADVATMTGGNFSSWYNQTEGSFVVGVDSFVNVSTTVYRPVAVSDGTDNNYISAYEYNGKWGAASKVANVFQFDLSQTSSYTANTPAKIALAYKANDFAASVNGNAALTDTSGSVPTVDRLGVGSQNSGAYLNGHLRSLVYFNTRLPNAQLQSLTA